MADDLHSFARRIDALDEIIDNANADKAQVYREAKKALREDLPAFREAMSQRRKRDKNPAAYNALKGRAAELLDALDNGVVLEHARAPARARERTTDLRSPEHRAAVAAKKPDRAETPEARPQAGEERATAPADHITESEAGPPIREDGERPGDRSDAPGANPSPCTVAAPPSLSASDTPSTAPAAPLAPSSPGEPERTSPRPDAVGTAQTAADEALRPERQQVARSRDGHSAMAEYLADAAANYTEAVGAIRAGIVERGEARLQTPHGAELCIGPGCPACAAIAPFKQPSTDDLARPAFLKHGTPENKMARGGR